MHKRAPVLWLGGRVTEEGYHVVVVRDLAHGDTRFFVLGRGLGILNCREGFELAVVEACWFTEGFEADARGFYGVEFGQGFDRRFPPVVLSDDASE
jgi:hypothetical protein